MSATDSRVASYVRAVEGVWAKRSGRAVVLSPREWTLVERWFERGIPLAIIEEAIEGCSERGRSKRAPRNLTYVAAAVEEAWRVVVEGRVARPGESVPAEQATLDAWSQWERVRADEACGPALRALLDRLLEQSKRGRSPEECDRELDRALPRAVPAELLERLRSGAAKQLAPYRERMSPGVAEQTLQRALIERLRERLGLPRLAEPVTETGALSRTHRRS